MSLGVAAGRNQRVEARERWCRRRWSSAHSGHSCSETPLPTNQGGLFDQLGDVNVETALAPRLG